MSEYEYIENSLNQESNYLSFYRKITRENILQAEIYKSNNFQIITKKNDSSCADELILKIMKIHSDIKPLLKAYRLGKFNALAPNLETNLIFGRLVELCQTSFRPGVIKEVLENISDQVCADLNEACTNAEVEMEKYFALMTLNWIESNLSTAEKKIQDYVKEKFSCTKINRPFSCSYQYDVFKRVSGLEALYFYGTNNEFPYFNNYRQMVEYGEGLIFIKLMQNDDCNRSPVLSFIGSGPLDLTCDFFAIFLNKHFKNGIKINCVEKDLQAFEVSQSLNYYKEKFGIIPTGCKNYVNSDATELSFCKDNYISVGKKNIHTDVLFIAAMIGEKAFETIIKLASQKTGNKLKLIFRDTHGLAGKLLYPERTMKELLPSNFTKLISSQPITHYKNRTLPKHSQDETICILPLEIINSTYGFVGN
jgi:hypothetical protein